MGRDFHRQKILKWRNLLCHPLLITSDEQPDTSAISPWVTKSLVRGWTSEDGEEARKEIISLCALVLLIPAAVADLLRVFWCEESQDWDCPFVEDLNPELYPWALVFNRCVEFSIFVKSLEDVTFLCSTELPVKCICRQLVRMHI